MTLAARLSVALAAGRERDVTLIASDLPERVDAAVEPMPAAVLVAVTDRATPGLILTQRTDHLRRHPGQVAFPGGRIDPEDADAVAAALREAHEEIALDPAAVKVIGPVDDYATVTGFSVTPVLAVVPPDLPLVPSEAEVARVFEVPFGFALDPVNHRSVSAEFAGRTRHFHEIVWRDHRIWGATAAMIVNLSRRLAW